MLATKYYTLQYTTISSAIIVYVYKIKISNQLPYFKFTRFLISRTTIKIYIDHQVCA